MPSPETTQAPTAAKRRAPAHKSFVMTKAQAVSSRAWWVVDATDKPLGRLASEVAHVLRGKHKPTYTPHEDTGDFVIVVNADKVKLTGDKLDKKFYYHHSGIPGGFTAESYRHLLARDAGRSRSRRPSRACSPRASSAARCSPSSSSTPRPITRTPRRSPSRSTSSQV